MKEQHHVVGVILLKENNRLNGFLTEDTRQQFKLLANQWQQYFKKIDESLSLYRDMIKNVSNSIPRFPKINLPKIEIDYKKIESVINHNSSNGWTMTGEIDVHFYIDEKLLGYSQEEADRHFFNYYEKNTRENYYRTKDILMEEIDNQWKEVLEDSFSLYEEDRFKVTIPMLISIVEGEISTITQSDKYGQSLFIQWENQILSEEQKFNLIVAGQVHIYV